MPKGVYKKSDIQLKRMRNHLKKLNGKGDKSPAWKGDKVGYYGLHKWLQDKYGNPNYCEKCKTTQAKRFEWANISGNYKRDISHFKRLCKSCHEKLDKNRHKKQLTFI